MNARVTPTCAAALAAPFAFALPCAAQVPKLVFDTGQAGDRMGASISAAGDFDGDLTPDFAVGSPEALVPNLFGTPEIGGIVEVFSANGDFVARGSGSPGTRFGAAIAGPLDRGAGDELVIGSPGAPGAPGRVHVTFPFGPFMGISYTLNGLQANDDFGAALALLADVTGDGVDDFVVGAPRYDTPNLFGGAVVDAGQIRIVSGAAGATVGTFYGVTADGRFGATLANVGDFDGDGRDDFAVGAPRDGAGKVFVYSTTSPAPLATFVGTQAGERFGTALAGVGDVDGGGVPDLLVGAPGHALTGPVFAPTGRAAVVRGEDGAPLFSWLGPFFTSFGHAVGTVDLEGDGARDFVVHAGRGPGTLARARVFDRATGATIHTIDDGAQDRDSPVLGVASFDAHPGEELMVGLPDLDGERGGAIFYGLATGGGPGPIPHFTVDDDGPADFDSIAVAILTVPGGSVLEVEGGEYGAFIVDRPIAIVARHAVGSPVEPAMAPAIAAYETGGVVLAGLATESLTLANLSGRTHVSDLSVTGGGVAVDDCQDVLLQSVSVAAASTIGTTRDGTHALDVRDSLVHVTGCDLVGSHGAPATFTPEDGGSGGDALRAHGSTVWVAATDLFGGDGAQGGFGGAVGGLGGAGARAEGGSQIRYRGYGLTHLAGGADGFPTPVFGAYDAYAVGAGNSVEHTNDLAAPVDGLGAVSAVPPRPLLSVDADQSVGGTASLRVMADLNLPLYLALAVVDVALEVPGFTGMPIWIDGSTTVWDQVTVGQGYGSFVEHSVPIPADPALAGFALTAQGFAVPPSGDILPTNAAQVVIRQP